MLDRRETDFKIQKEGFTRKKSFKKDDCLRNLEKVTYD